MTDMKEMDTMAIELAVDKVREEGGIEVMKASAGSGKTFSLAKEYIRLLLVDGRSHVYPHKNILAVTFTNKATAEMKERIIKELDILANKPEKSDFREYLLEKCEYGSDIGRLKEDAKRSLSQILGDYGSFSVCTIDKFFQRTLRSFAREIGQFTEYSVELDKDSIVSESVDRVLDGLSEDEGALLGWLSDSAVQNMEEGEGYRLESMLHNFARHYMSPTFSAKAASFEIDESKAFSDTNIKKIQGICNKVCGSYKKDLKVAVAKAEASISGYDEVTNNVTKAFAKFRRYFAGEIDSVDLGLTWVKVCDDGRNAFKSKTKKNLPDALSNEISRCFLEVRDFFDGVRHRQFNTARILRRQVSLFRVADSIRQSFNQLQAEKGVLCLDNSNDLLRDIISDSDVPFVYEKLGVRYRHFLLDEFQDTALVQWNNFLPLLKESISHGFYNLVVGDVKQSIYRWRDADWSILNNLNPDDSSLKIALDPLDSNWRSTGNVVRFNNGFYAWASKEMDERLAGRRGLVNDGLIGSIYKEVEQKAKKKFKHNDDTPMEGWVDVTFCESKEDVVNNAYQAVVDAHDNCRFDYKDIAVVVRANALGADVASALVQSGIPVVSSDSLLISSSQTVRKLVACLCRVDNSRDDINGYFAGEFDPSTVKGRSLTELSESLLRIDSLFDRGQINNDTPYLSAFMDFVREYEASHGNSLHSFLNHWQENGLKRCISSPEGSDAVTVITIHKSKGLSFPFVVFPLAGNDSFVSGRSNSWEAMAVEDDDDAGFSGVEKALYDVRMSESLTDSYFGQSYLDEVQMAYVDWLNMWYVATTRPSQALHIIAPKPSKDMLSGKKEGFTSLPDYLYVYVNGRLDNVADDRFRLGQVSVKSLSGKKEDETETLEYSYFSLPTAETGVRNNIRIKSEADGSGISNAILGTVLHSIMESVMVPEDLASAVAAAVADGRLTENEAAEEEAAIRKAMEMEKARNWFVKDDGYKIVTERDIAVPFGNPQRPDRVIIKPDGVDIVDYKFGAEDPEYKSQVCRYAELYRQMGYSNVTPYIWYIHSCKLCPQ